MTPMSQTVPVPLWLLVLLIACAALAALQWLLIPGVRWYFRRKVKRVLDEIGVRLAIELPQFKLTRRRALIDRLMIDPRVVTAAQVHAQEHGEPLATTMRRVMSYANEIVPAFNAYIYFRRNVAGSQREWWHHRSGCRAWFLAERDTRTNEVLRTELPRGEPDA